MSSNRFHNIFGSRKGINRKDIERYRSSQDPIVKNEVEQQALTDVFEADSFEGWEEMSHDTTVLSKLDKKFAPKSWSGLYITAGIGTIAVVIVLAFFFNGKKEHLAEISGINQNKELLTELMEDQQITLDESDVILPIPIEKMKSAPKKDQVQPVDMIQTFQEMNEINNLKEKGEEITATLPIQTPLANSKPEAILNHKSAKEIYLHDFKLVDYRVYRTKSQVKTKQMVLTGLPASMEDEHTDEQDPIWKDVEVPYIEYLDKSMKIFERKNYKRALTRFETILATYNTDINANFYGGLSLYNLGEYAQAQVFFDACIIGPYANFDEEALWLKAECLMKSGDRLKALIIYKKIAASNGFYAVQASKKLK